MGKGPGGGKGGGNKVDAHRKAREKGKKGPMRERDTSTPLGWAGDEKRVKANEVSVKKAHKKVDLFWPRRIFSKRGIPHCAQRKGKRSKKGTNIEKEVKGDGR